MPPPARRRRRARTGVAWWQTPEMLAARRGRIRLPRRTLLLRCLLGAAGLLVVAPLLLLGVGYLALSVPGADEAADNQAVTLTFADGSELARLLPDRADRVPVPLDRIPEPVRRAVLTTQDPGFATAPVPGPFSLVGDAWDRLRGRPGGTTITEQYVRTALAADGGGSAWRAYEEVVLSVKVARERSKDEILAGYLDSAYFGRGAYGIGAAAHVWFAKDAGELSPAEGALLAGLIGSPARWDPATDPQRAVQRWDSVMDGMVAGGALTPAERAAATFPTTEPRRPTAHPMLPDSRGHVVSAVLAELDTLGIPGEELARGGLRITTTIDPVQQERAERAARQALAGQPANLRSAVVAVDPRTGGISAYYGGDNGAGPDYARIRRQAGSTFTPFVVLAALTHEPPIGLGTVVDRGRRDVKQAMTASDDAVFTGLAARVGPERVAAAARAAGITSPPGSPDSRIALGTAEVTPVELVSAYATLASGGVRHAPHLVSSVVTADGQVLHRAPDAPGERMFSERVTRNAVEAMLGVAQADDRAIGRPVAAKPGTVQSRFAGQNNDAWFSGFTPGLATTVWIGTDVDAPIRTASGAPIDGRSLPGDVWQAFMAETVQEQPAPEAFGSYTPIGEPAADAPPTGTAAPTTAPATPPGERRAAGQPGSGPAGPTTTAGPGRPATGSGTASGAQPAPAQPGAAPPAGQPGAPSGPAEPGPAEPGPAQPGPAQPGAGEAGAAQPGPGQPDTASVGSGQPGGTQPGTGAAPSGSAPGARTTTARPADPLLGPGQAGP